MPTKSSVNNDRTKTILTWTVIILSIALVLSWLKYVKSEFRWFNYAPVAQQVIFEAPNYTAREEAWMIADTITTVPTSQNPLYKESTTLESYISSISNGVKRDMVVVDTNKMILADTVSKNVGSKFMEDKGNEVGQTIADGNIRSFEEISGDYPKGITQVVLPMKDQSGKALGAVIVSITQIK